jgi:site-specific DNA recombinase
MVKRAILYARVSGDDRGNDGRNLKGQLEMCREYARQHSWQVVAEMAEDDRGASGASFELPKLNEVLKLAQSGRFDVLVVREIDRLSRKLAKQLIVEEELKRHNVRIEYALGEYPDTPEGNLMKNLKASIAEYERLKISERIVRGRQQKVKAGSVLVYGNPPYGYRVVEKGGKWVLEIHEPEAQIVRLVFEWYTQGDGENGPMSMAGITRKLTEMNIPTYADVYEGPAQKMRGRYEWSRSTVSLMLKNKTYAGTWYYGKLTEREGKRVRNDKDRLIAVDVPAIVTHPVWDAAQKRRIWNRQTAGRKGKCRYLLSGRVACGICGVKVAGSSSRSKNKLYLYYRCPGTNRMEYSVKCSLPRFRAEQVDLAVWEWVKSFLSEPEALCQGLQAYQQECEAQNAPIRDRLGVVEDLLAANRSQLARLLDLYISGDLPREMLTDRKARLERTIQALEKELVDLSAHLKAGTLDDTQILSLENFAKEVSEGLEAADGDFEARRAIIESLNVHVTLTVEESKKVIYARCALGESVLPVESISTCPSAWPR